MTHWRAQLPLGTGTWTRLGFAESSRTTVSRSSARIDLSKKPAWVFEFIRLSPQTSPSGSCETNETRFPPRPTRFPLRLQRLPVGPLPSAPRRSATLRRPLRSRSCSPPLPPALHIIPRTPPPRPSPLGSIAHHFSLRDLTEAKTQARFDPKNTLAHSRLHPAIRTRITRSL